MASKIYVGNSNKSKLVKNIYVGVGNKAKAVKKIYVGVGGKAKLAYSALTTINCGSSTVKNIQAGNGDSTYLTFNLSSSMYVSSVSFTYDSDGAAHMIYIDTFYNNTMTAKNNDPDYNGSTISGTFANKAADTIKIEIVHISDPSNISYATVSNLKVTGTLI